MMTPLAKMIDAGYKSTPKRRTLRQIQVRLEIAVANNKGKSIFSDERKELSNAINACRRAKIHDGFIIRCLLA